MSYVETWIGGIPTRCASGMITTVFSTSRSDSLMAPACGAGSCSAKPAICARKDRPLRFLTNFQRTHNNPRPLPQTLFLSFSCCLLRIISKPPSTKSSFYASGSDITTLNINLNINNVTPNAGACTATNNPRASFSTPLRTQYSLSSRAAAASLSIT